MIIKNAKSLEESVFLTLEEEILSGELKRGDTLTEMSLSERLGVSRTPLRAALHRLDDEGLVKIETNRGAVVVGVTHADLVNIYKVRMRLASGEAAINITKEDLGELRDSVELSEFYLKKQDTEHLKELDSTFHNIIYRASGNRHLEKILSEMHRNIRTYRKISLTVPDRLERSIKEHREILKAIESGDSALADRLTYEHIHAALENLLTVAK